MERAATVVSAADAAKASARIKASAPEIRTHALQQQWEEEDGPCDLLDDQRRQCDWLMARGRRTKPIVATTKGRQLDSRGLSSTQPVTLGFDPDPNLPN